MRPLLLLVLACAPWACQNVDYCAPTSPCQGVGTRDAKTHLCVYPGVPDGTGCSDHSVCTGPDRCVAGVCTGPAVVCAAAACQVAGVCDPNNGCPPATAAANGTACDDQSACTHPDSCQAGVCQGPSVVTCSGAAADSCHLPQACDPNTGACGSAAKPGPCDAGLMPSPTVGCSLMVYGAQFSVGNSVVNLLLDSGSTTLAVANSNCTNCGDIAPLYTPGPSGQYLQTSVQSSYLDGSGWNGRAYSDRVTPLGTSDGTSMRFAGINSQNNFFLSAGCVLGDPNANDNFYQGIVGLAGQSIAVTGTDSYLDKVKSSLPNNAFSMLMCNPNGLIWFGGYDPLSTSAVPQFTPFVSTSTFYYVDVTGMSLGTTALTGASGQSVVDTGTSLILLPEEAISALIDQMAANDTFISNFGDSGDPTGSTQSFFLDGYCYAATDAPEVLDAALPPLRITFPGGPGGASGSFTVELAATESYLQKMAATGGSVGYCSGVSTNSVPILGAASMVGHVFIFDRANSQLGIAASTTCAEM